MLIFFLGPFSRNSRAGRPRFLVYFFNVAGPDGLKGHRKKIFKILIILYFLDMTTFVCAYSLRVVFTGQLIV
jgi:hypothetical protein